MKKIIIAYIMLVSILVLHIPMTAFAADAEARGNTIGNIANGGDFAIQDDWIFGSDGGGLYKIRTDGTQKKILDADGASDINVAGNWVYYYNCVKQDTGAGYRMISNGLYKIRTDGTMKTQLDDSLIAYNINVVDDWIYYASGNRYTNVGNMIFKIRTNGKDKTMLVELNSDDSIYDVTVTGGWVYYKPCSATISNNGTYEINQPIHKIRTNGKDNTLVTTDNSEYINIVGDWIYYINNDDKNPSSTGPFGAHFGGRVYKIRTDGTSKTKLTDCNVITMNVVDDWIYYRDDSQWYIRKIRTDGTSDTEIVFSSVSYGTSDIALLNEWIYYKDGACADFEFNKIRTDGTDAQKLGYAAAPSENAPNKALSTLDTASEWARDGIESAIAKGFVPSDMQDKYQNIITREQFCRMAIKWVEYRTGDSIENILAKNNVSRNYGIFTDTTDPDILAAHALGITNGTSKTTFTPSGQFTREQAATMLRNTCRVVGIDISDTSSAGFSDIYTASDWAVDAINFCRNSEIMMGIGNNRFNPKAQFTIEQSILTFNNIED